MALAPRVRRIANPRSERVVNRRQRRLLRLHRRALRAPTPGGVATLEHVKDARRPLLFSRMPRMLGGDGRTADILRNEFRYIDNDTKLAPATAVSPRRWYRALATARRISLRRKRGGD
jgi:hypothetical protein